MIVICAVCGFMAGKTQRPIQDAVLDMFAELDTRGTDASGFASSVGGKLWFYKNDVPSSQLVAQMSNFQMNKARSWIGHCRMATQGNQVFNQNNHPFVQTGLALIHNGMLFNYHEMWEKTKGDGLYGDCDSELILARILHHRQRRGVTRAIQEMARELDGEMACALINKRGDLWLWRRETWEHKGYAFTPMMVAVSNEAPNIHFASLRKCLEQSLNPELTWDITSLDNNKGLHLFISKGELRIQKFDVPDCSNPSGGWGGDGFYEYEWDNVKSFNKKEEAKYQPLLCKTCKKYFTTAWCRNCHDYDKSGYPDLTKPSRRVLVKGAGTNKYTHTLPEELGLRHDALYVCEICDQYLVVEELEIHKIELGHYTYREEIV